MADDSDQPHAVRETVLPPAPCETVIAGGTPPDPVRETLAPAAVVDATFQGGADVPSAPDQGSSSPQGDSPSQTQPEEPETPPAEDAGHEEESA